MGRAENEGEEEENNDFFKGIGLLCTNKIRSVKVQRKRRRRVLTVDSIEQIDRKEARSSDQ